MKKKSITSCIALGLSIMLTTTVMATPSSDLNTKKDQLKQSQSQLNDAKNSVQNIEIQIEKLDSAIVKAMTDSKKTQEKIEKIKEDMKKAEAEVKKAEQKVQEKQKLYNKRMRKMYINGTDGYINVIFEAKSFSDIFSKVENIKRISSFDRKIINDLQENKKELQDKKAKLIKENKSLEDVKKQQDNRVKKLENDKLEQKKLIDKAKAVENEYNNKVNMSKEEVQKIQEKIEQEKQKQRYIEQERQKAPAYVPARGAANLSANSLVAYASNFMGTPYVWGGTTPSGFDCSGFMQYVYGHFGISIGRTTYAQVTKGKSVGTNISNLQAGDLVFFGSEPHHVGMYVGNDWYIHSPRTGDSIKLSKLSSRRDFSSARRIK